MSTTLTELSSLISREVGPVMLESYAARPSVLPKLGRITPVSPEGIDLGFKGAVIADGGYLDERNEHQPYNEDRIRQAHQWQCKVREFAKIFQIDRRTWAAINSRSQVIANIMQWARTEGGNTMATKERFVAGMFQKGTLTAGSLAYFDNTYSDNVDPYPKFIYDNLPWFDTAHPAQSGATYANHVVSSALSHANLETMQILTDQTNAFNERGLPMNIQHNVLLVPVNLRATAERIVMSERVAGSAANDVNPLRGRYEVVAWNQLTDNTAAWWTGVMGNMVEIYDSGPPRIRVEEQPGTPFVNLVMDTYFGATVAQWRNAACANKAAS